MRYILRRLTAALLGAGLVMLTCSCSVLPAVSPSASDNPAPGASADAKSFGIPNLESRYFLSQLSGSELEFCRLAYAGLMELGEDIDVSAAKISFDRADELIQALFDDCPELYMCGSDYTLVGISSVSSLRFNYRMTRDEYLSAGRQTAALIARWREVTDGMDDYSRELYVHDAICGGCTYSESSALGDTACGALLDGEAFCQGYAKAFQLVMQNLGFRCLFVSSESLVHSWNLIELDGSFYQVDLTWDDSGDRQTYAYFNLGDADMEKLEHVYDRSELLNYPLCPSSELSYYAVNGLYISSGEDVRSAFTAQLDRVYASGGGRIMLMFEESSQLDELIAGQSEWISDWSANGPDRVSFSRLIPYNNSFVYIAEFSFS